jgi:hypothetical protein
MALGSNETEAGAVVPARAPVSAAPTRNLPEEGTLPQRPDAGMSGEPTNFDTRDMALEGAADGRSVSLPASDRRSLSYIERHCAPKRRVVGA